MVTKVFEWICLFFFGVIFIFSIKYLIHVFIILFKRKLRNKRIRKNILQFIVAVMIVVLLFSSVKGFAKNVSRSMNFGKGGAIDLFQNQDVVDDIPFHDEAFSDERIWEHLYSVELAYGNCEEWLEKESEFGKLRENYINRIYKTKQLSFIKVEELLEHINFFYGTEILPSTNKTLDEVTAEILPLKDRLNTDVEVFQNEFWLRATKVNKYSSDECLYQVGRAADDAFKVLFKKQPDSVKPLIFYGSMVVAFYLASIGCYKGNIDLAYAYYRIAEIYIYLEKYVNRVKCEEKYSKHCLLMAEVFLMLAETEYSDEIKEGDIHQRLTYFDCYYAEILYKAITSYEFKEEEFITLCCNHATQYLSSAYSKRYPKCRKSCSDIIVNLE